MSHAAKPLATLPVKALSQPVAAQGCTVAKAEVACGLDIVVRAKTHQAMLMAAATPCKQRGAVSVQKKHSGDIGHWIVPPVFTTSDRMQVRNGAPTSCN